jgi:superfamily II DNA or RNA helicase
LVELEHAGFSQPTPIQCQAWPVLLQGQDLIGIAQTGTGKTLAFLIHIDNQPIPRVERGGPNVLVLSSTRELALQIEREVKKYYYKGIKSCCLFGGGSRQEQVTSVQAGVVSSFGGDTETDTSTFLLLVFKKNIILNPLINAPHIRPNDAHSICVAQNLT